MVRLPGWVPSLLTVPLANLLHTIPLSATTAFAAGQKRLPPTKTMAWRKPPSTTTVRRASSSPSPSSFPDESDCQFPPKKVLGTIVGVDWNDRIALQQKWPNQDKGWQVLVKWKETPFGVALFAAQNIKHGTILRMGTTGNNLIQFRTVEDIDAFCRQQKNSSSKEGGSSSIQNDDDDDGAEYRARLSYVKDYLWGYSPSQTDDKGYDLSPYPHTETDRFYGMWIPGNGLNHNPTPNTVYQTRKGGTDKGIVLMALGDISEGKELLDDYRRHGRAPQWLLKFAESKQLSLNFAECNEFVNTNSDDGDGDASGSHGGEK